jgi:hypothetical protein
MGHKNLFRIRILIFYPSRVPDFAFEHGVFYDMSSEHAMTVPPPKATAAATATAA